MSAPYRVWLVSPTRDHTTECATLGEALAKAMIQKHDLRQHEEVRILGDGAEGGYGDDGQGFHDGLTDDERELVNEVLT